MKHNIFNTWDIAFHHGHSAFRLLRLVYDIEEDYSRNLAVMKNLDCGNNEYLSILGKNHYLVQDHFRLSAACIMLFQAMMEALINDSISRNSRLRSLKEKTFAEKWERCLSILGRQSSSFE